MYVGMHSIRHRRPSSEIKSVCSANQLVNMIFSNSFINATGDPPHQ